MDFQLLGQRPQMRIPEPKNMLFLFVCKCSGKPREIHICLADSLDIGGCQSPSSTNFIVMETFRWCMMQMPETLEIHVRGSVRVHGVQRFQYAFSTTRWSMLGVMSLVCSGMAIHHTHFNRSFPDRDTHKLIFDGFPC
jgi:hypothetical protein